MDGETAPGLNLGVDSRLVQGAKAARAG